MSYTNYLINTILMITTVYHLLNIIPIAFSIDDTELDHICLPSNKKFTSSYNESRALVVIDVIINTASHQGFRNASYTWFRNSSSTLDDPDEWCYGLAQCRGDVSADDCKTCVNNATITLINTTHCPHRRSAIIWRDYCLFKYSDVDFFGIIDTGNMFSSTGDSTWILGSSSDEVKNLMDSLQETAIATPVLYASGNVKFSDDPIDPRPTTTVYGLVQCTRDLSKDNCEACLGSAIGKLTTLKQGGRVVYGSCNVRYETYPL
ncbi:hypothetical protein CASFOL_040842 [Castilleja foliolosa]|uniref:Gnk2-homologous domain-containing protein n=1 Tax=Castilleja foliolosa TaxID=1961234 RepID=A0ABD3BDN1_9LAMI